MKSIPILALVFLFLLAAGQAVEESDLPVVDLTAIQQEGNTLPLAGQEVPGFAVLPNWTGGNAGQPLLVADLDGDGDDEAILSRLDFVLISSLDQKFGHMIHDQVNFPRKFRGRSFQGSPLGSGFSVQGPFDLDGDGNQEIMAWGATEDFREWGFWVVEIRKTQGRFTLHQEGGFFLGPQPERRADDQWDGRYAVIGCVPGLLENPQQQALILTVNVGFDLEGRGIMAVDPYSGRVLWHFTCGPKPYPHHAQVLDLDQDGSPEIVFTGGSTDNLHGEKIGSYSDDHSRLFVLDSLGREKWSRRICGERSTGHLALADLHPAPGIEVVTAGRETGLTRANIQIWSPTGEMLDELLVNDSTNSLAVAPGSATQAPAVFLGTASGALWRFEWTADGLQPAGKALLGSLVFLPNSHSLNQFPTSRLIVQDQSDNAWILDPDLQPRACLDLGPNRVMGRFDILHSQGREYLPGFAWETGRGLKLVPNPLALPTNPVLRLLARTPLWVWATALLTLLALSGWGLLAMKHHQDTRRRARVPLDSDHLRETRLHLLEDLELSGHGAIAPLRSLRRLLWLLDAMKTGIDLSEGLSTRLLEVWTDCHRDDLPRLLTILDRAQAANIDHSSIPTAIANLENILLDLAALKEHNFDPGNLGEIAERLHQEGAATEAALQALRQEIGQHFICDLDQVLAKVLRANEEGLNSLSVAVETGWAAETTAGASGGEEPSGSASLQCRIDAGELEFILDNLVGNACRAMEGATRRSLRFSWLPTNGMVKLQITDTGIGIASEDRDAVLNTRLSTKQRGGLGLPKSVNILRKYGGELSIKSSSPGGGTTFQLLLPRAHD